MFLLKFFKEPQKDASNSGTHIQPSLPDHEPTPTEMKTSQLESNSLELNAHSVDRRIELKHWRPRPRKLGPLNLNGPQGDNEVGKTHRRNFSHKPEKLPKRLELEGGLCSIDGNDKEEENSMTARRIISRAEHIFKKAEGFSFRNKQQFRGDLDKIALIEINKNRYLDKLARRHLPNEKRLENPQSTKVERAVGATLRRDAETMRGLKGPSRNFSLDSSRKNLIRKISAIPHRAQEESRRIFPLK